jgi:hypothetical protein
LLPVLGYLHLHLAAQCTTHVSAYSSTSSSISRLPLDTSILEQAVAVAVAVAVAEAAASHEKIKELRVLVGCNSYNNSNNSTYTDWSSHSHNCLQAAASRMHSQRKADEAAATKFLVQLRNRTNVYCNIDLIVHHPALIPMIRKYQPLPEWNINILPVLAIVTLPYLDQADIIHYTGNLRKGLLSKEYNIHTVLYHHAHRS